MTEEQGNWMLGLLSSISAILFLIYYEIKTSRKQ